MLNIICQGLPNLKDKDNDNNKNNRRHLLNFHDGGQSVKHFIRIVVFNSYDNPRKLELLLTLFYR